MYVPHYFRNEDINEVREFIDKNGFGILVSCGDMTAPRPFDPSTPLRTGSARGDSARDELKKGQTRTRLRRAAHDFPTASGGAPNYVPIATHIPMLLDKDGQGRDILSGHIARMNPHPELFAPATSLESDGNPPRGWATPKVLAIFMGPHAYVSSSWYSQENVPTWNYIAVHVYGTLKIIEGDRLYRQLKMLVDKYESLNEPHLQPLPDTERGNVGAEHVLPTLKRVEHVQPLQSITPSRVGKGDGGLGSTNPTASGGAPRVYLEKMSPAYVKKQMAGIVGFEILIEEIQAAYKLSQNRTEQDFENVIRELEKRGDPQSKAVAEEMKEKRKG